MLHALNPRDEVSDFLFLIDIAELVIAARRALSYTYALRYYLKGAKKQSFCDFM